MEETKVIYHIDDDETPYLVKLSIAPERVTLADFKNVLNRPNYKYFFKSMDDDFGMIQKNFVDMENMFDLLKEEPEVIDAPGAPRLSVAGGKIEFRNVTFGYTPDRIVLRNINMQVPAGRTLALVNFFVGAFYDGVYLLGMALNETLSQGMDIRDGKAITKQMWGREFLGITGHVRIDENGERDADYSILDLDPITGRFEVVAHYYSTRKVYNPVPGKKIHWPGGKDGPPPDVPPCGFMRNDPACNVNEAHMILLYGTASLCIFIACAIVVAFFANNTSYTCE